MKTFKLLFVNLLILVILASPALSQNETTNQTTTATANVTTVPTAVATTVAVTATAVPTTAAPGKVRQLR
ncbi:MAG: hypothetical protein O8C64_10630 [Candidatus Methanoperedens sp.]|nr:hypothetical protein [Candidatus Methanoperedens sp.]